MIRPENDEVVIEIEDFNFRKLCSTPLILISNWLSDVFESPFRFVVLYSVGVPFLQVSSWLVLRIRNYPVRDPAI